MKVTTILKRMFLENTGTHMLDSGGANNRGWQRNQKRDFNNEPNATLEFNVYNDNELEVYPSVNTYQFLCSALDRDKTCSDLQREFNKYCNSNDDCYLINMESFLELKDFTYQTVNTYNFDNSLDNVIQYCTFRLDNQPIDCYDDLYIMLQIHNGCDVRGGYTSPKIFKITDIENWYRMDDVYTNAGIDFMGIDTIDSDSGGSAKDLKEYFEVKDGKLYNKKGEIAQAYTLEG